MRAALFVEFAKQYVAIGPEVSDACRLPIRFAIFSDAALIRDIANAAYSGPDSHKGWTPEIGLFDSDRITLEEAQDALVAPITAIILCETSAGPSTARSWITPGMKHVLDCSRCCRKCRPPAWGGQFRNTRKPVRCSFGGAV